MTGMDRAIYFSGIGIILTSFVSYFLIKDSVVETPVDAPVTAPERELAAHAAD